MMLSFHPYNNGNNTIMLWLRPRGWGVRRKWLRGARSKILMFGPINFYVSFVRE